MLPVFREVRYLNAAEMYAVKEQIGKLEVQTEDTAGRSVRICWSITACIPGRSAFTVRSCKTAIRGNRASVLCRRTEQYGGGVRKDVPVPRGRRLSVAVL